MELDRLEDFLHDGRLGGGWDPQKLSCRGGVPPVSHTLVNQTFPPCTTMSNTTPLLHPIFRDTRLASPRVCKKMALEPQVRGASLLDRRAKWRTCGQRPSRDPMRRATETQYVSHCALKSAGEDCFHKQLDCEAVLIKQETGAGAPVFSSIEEAKTY